MGKEAFLLLVWVVLLALAEWHWGGARKERPSDRRLLTNFTFTAIVFAAGTILPITKLAASSAAQFLNIGLLRSVQLPWPVIFAVALLAETGAAYWLHRIAHATPLWRLHRVHHSDDAVDLSTSFRNHPLELMISLPVSALVVLVLGTPPSVVVETQMLLAAATLWQHADIDLPPRLERQLASVIVTPAIHRVHHNPKRQVHDSNYGELITLWDRLFGTFIAPDGRGPVGLEAPVVPSDRLLQQIWSPVYSA